MLLLMILSLSLACDNNLGCVERDFPICQGGNCVECTDHEHCDVTAWCTTEFICQDYTESLRDEEPILGGFCNSAECVDMNDAVVCGDCIDDPVLGISANWQGACIDYKCEPCDTTKYPFFCDGDIEICGQHASLGGCFPSGPTGKDGVMHLIQTSDDAPKGVSQTSASIAFVVLGIGFFFMLIMQCLLLFKTPSTQ